MFAFLPCRGKCINVLIIHGADETNTSSIADLTSGGADISTIPDQATR